MRVGGLPRLDHLHIACRQVVERVVGVVVLLLAVLSPVVATFGQLQVHHLSVMVMMHSHCYHCEHNGKADYDYGQSFVHSAAKVKILFHIYKYYKLFFMTRCLFSIVYVLRCLPQRGLSAAIRLLGRSAALLRKNWQQVKHSDAIFAVSTIANDDTVNGGTGWAVQMAIDNTNDVVDIMTRFKSQLHIDAVSPL